MIQIPMIEQTVGAAAAPLANVQPLQVDNSVATALQGLGDATEKLSDAGANSAVAEKKVMEKAAHETAVAWVGPAISDFQLQYGQRAQDLRTATPAGSDGFHALLPSLLAEYDQKAADLVKAAPNDAAKKLVNASLMQYRTQMGQQTIAWMHQQDTDFKINSYNKTIEDNTKLAVANPNLFDSYYQTTADLIKNSGLDQQFKSQLEAKQQLMAFNFLSARSQTDPKGVYNDIVQRYFPDGTPSPNPKMSARPDLADLRAKPGEPGTDTSQWGKREDGTDKGMGFLGLLRRKDGGVSSEISIGVPINGKEMDIPLMVPTLTRPEVEQLLNSPIDAKEVPQPIVDKAIAFAQKRIAEGKSVFAQTGEDLVPGRAPGYGGPKTLNARVEQAAPFFEASAQKWGVDANILRAQAQQESKGDPSAVSEKGAQGFSQFIPATAARYGVDVRSVESSINGQAHYMSDLLKLFGGDYTKAVAAYNMGEGDPQKKNGVSGLVIKYGDNWLAHAPPETRDYVAKVMGNVDAPPDQSTAQDTVIRSGIAQNGDQAGPSGNPAVDKLTVPQALQLMQTASAAVRNQSAGAEAQFNLRVKDSSAAALQGIVDQNPPTLEDFRRFKGAMGDSAYANYQRDQQLGHSLQQVATLSDDDQKQMLAASKPTAVGPGFADQQHNYEILDRAIQQSQQTRRQDPLGYALFVKRPGINPITDKMVLDPNAFAAELQNRVLAAEGVAKDYGTGYALMSKDETKGLTNVIAHAPVYAQKQILASIYKGAGSMDTYKFVMQQLAPDQPVLAAAGIYQARQRMTTATTDRPATDVADLVLRGYSAMHPISKEDGGNHEGGKSLVRMPKIGDMRDGFDQNTGVAFLNDEKTKDLYFQKAQAIYAARSIEEGDDSGNLNSNRWKSSIQLATGGVQRHNGAEVILPWAMPYDTFKDQIARRAPQAAGAGVNVSADEITRLPLQAVGDGRYQIRRGTGFIVGPDHRPVIMDFNTPAPPKVAGAAPGPVGLGAPTAQPGLPAIKPGATAGVGPTAMAAGPDAPQAPSMHLGNGAAAWHAGQQAREDAMQ